MTPDVLAIAVWILSDVISWLLVAEFLTVDVGLLTTGLLMSDDDCAVLICIPEVGKALVNCFVWLIEIELSVEMPAAKVNVVVKGLSTPLVCAYCDDVIGLVLDENKGTVAVVNAWLLLVNDSLSAGVLTLGAV